MAVENWTDMSEGAALLTENIVHTLYLDIYDIFHLIIGVIGILCNIITIMVIVKYPVSNSSRVNLFILNQSVVDLLSSMFLIIFALFLEASQYTGVLGEFLCRFWSPGSHKFLFGSFAISTYNLTAMSIERYTAVVHYLSYKKIFTRKNTIFMIISVWILGPVVQLIPIVKLTVLAGECRVKDNWSSVKGALVGTSLFIWEYLMPCMIMTWAYVMIIEKLRNNSVQTGIIQDNAHDNAGNVTTARNFPHQVKHKNITITVFILVIVYIICWTPNQITFLQFNLGGPLDFRGGWYHFTVLLAFCNTFSNTFVYVLKQKHFQRVVKNVIMCRHLDVDDASSISGSS